MKICEVVQPIEELDPNFVNRQASQNNWDMVGRGYTSSVWSHFSDPDTVVKLVGGGRATGVFTDDSEEHRAATLAFIHCCVDHGKENKHLPNILGINVDDNEVLQVRMERLQPLPDSLETGALRRVLGELERAVNSQGWKEPTLQDLDEALHEEGLDRYQSAEDLFNVVAKLQKLSRHYGMLHHYPNISMDLHSDNWMMHPNGTIVAVDPWV